MNMNKTEFKKAHKGAVKTDLDNLYDEVMAHKKAYKKQEGITDKD